MDGSVTGRLALMGFWRPCEKAPTWQLSLAGMVWHRLRGHAVGMAESGETRGKSRKNWHSIWQVALAGIEWHW